MGWGEGGVVKDMLALPQAGRYAMVVADPPWHFRARSTANRLKWKSRRDAEHHYAVMGLDDIKALPVRALAAPDAHLFLWTTGPNLQQAFDVIAAWGFRYSGIGFTWIKLKRSIDTRQLRIVSTQESDLHVGLGFTTRKNAEFCLLARRGNAKRVSKSVREIILAPVREHSRKPDEFYRRAMAYATGPYVELFSREPRAGWDAWGAETGKFAPAQVAA
jgi:N6-adenosine-specific RNA methylase IME4